MSQQFTDDQSVVGATRHSTTGAYIVWVSLDGNDVTPVGAWKSEAVAAEAVQETAGEFHRLMEAMESAAPEDSEEAGVEHWAAFLEKMKGRSDAAMTPFPPSQLTQMGQHIQKLMQQRRSVPDKPEGFSRVLIYSPDALEGTEMSRVRLMPMQRKNKGQR